MQLTSKGLLCMQAIQICSFYHSFQMQGTGAVTIHNASEAVLVQQCKMCIDAIARGASSCTAKMSCPKNYYLVQWWSRKRTQLPWALGCLTSRGAGFRPAAGFACIGGCPMEGAAGLQGPSTSRRSSGKPAQAGAIWFETSGCWYGFGERLHKSTVSYPKSA